MKTILLPYFGTGSDSAAFETAVKLAKQFNAYLEGLFIKQLPPIIAGEGITLPGDYIAHLNDENQRVAELAAAAFKMACGESGLRFVSGHGPNDSPSAGWQESEGLVSQVIAEYGRLFDLLVIDRSDSSYIDWKVVCESALFDSGRPVMIAPMEQKADLARRILIIWSGSTESTRSVASALPLLHGADAVKVISIAGATVAGPGLDQLVLYLARQGISTESEALGASTGKSPGELALEHAKDWGADMLVKGAYTHSRLRAMIFGTVTSHVINEARLPVFMAH